MNSNYRNKPTIVQAVQWDGMNWDEIVEFIGYGPWSIRVGAWAIKDHAGGYEWVNDDDFQRLYEPGPL